MLSSVGWALSDMADAVVLGQRLGATGLAAISMILPIYMLNCMMAHGLGLGGSVRFSYHLGKGNFGEARKHFSTILTATLFFSILTAILGTVFLSALLPALGTRPKDGALYTATKDYLQILILSTPLFYLSNVLNYFLRNDGFQKRAGIGSLIGNLSDISLNILLVLVFGLGTRGAALSTTIGQIIAILIYLPALFRKDHNLRPLASLRFLRSFPLREALQSLRSGLATSVSYLYQMIFFLICNHTLMHFSGENGVAVFDVLQNTSYLILYLYEGTARAVQPVLSTYYGERNLIGMKNIRKLGFSSGILVGSLLIALVFFFPSLFTALFGISKGSIQLLAMRALRIYAFGAFFAGISILLCNDYQSVEHLKAVVYLETMRGALILIPATILFSFLGTELFWWLFPTTEILSLVIFELWRRITKYTVDTGDPGRVFQTTIEGNLDSFGETLQAIEAFSESHDASPKQQYFVVMAVEELVSTIFQKGLTHTKDGYILITLVAAENGDFQLHIRDNAVKFNPFDMKTKKAAVADQDAMDAMGILVLKNKASEFHYHRYQGFNAMVLTI